MHNCETNTSEQIPTGEITGVSLYSFPIPVLRSASVLPAPLPQGGRSWLLFFLPHSFPFLCSIFPPWMYVALNDIIIAWFELYQNVLFLSFTEYAVPEIQLLMLVTGSSSPFSPLPSFPHISCFTTKASRCAKPTAQFPPWVSAQSTFVEWNWARTDC